MAHPPPEIVLQNGSHCRVTGEAQRARKAYQRSLAQPQLSSDFTGWQERGFLLVFSKKICNPFLALGQRIELLADQLTEFDTLRFFTCGHVEFTPGHLIDNIFLYENHLSFVTVYVN